MLLDQIFKLTSNEKKKKQYELHSKHMNMIRLHIYRCFTCIAVCALHVCGGHRSPADPLELYLQMVVSYRIGVGN